MFDTDVRKSCKEWPLEVLLFLCFFCSTAISKDFYSDHHKEQFHFPVNPQFEYNTSSNVTVQFGLNAFLHCKVYNLGDRTVSWIRRKDFHILTAGSLTYISDERFNIIHKDGSTEWILQIKFVNEHDEGTYECQVPTDTGVMSYIVHLKVQVPEAFILGGAEYHVKTGSSLTLVCIVDKSSSPPKTIYWYHNDQMINYDHTRPGVQVTVEPGARTHSRLTVVDARLADSGNYTCSAPNTRPVSILVFVTEGDKMAAIHKLNDSCPSTLKVSLIVMWISVLISWLNR